MSTTKGKPIKCRAAIAWSKGATLSIETVEVAPPEKKEVRIQIISTGICYTDVSFINSYIPNQHYPFLAGHEAAGIVESIGDEVKLFKVGDHVIPIFLPQCQQCDLCKHPDTSLCKMMINEKGQLQSDPKAITCKGKLVSQMLDIGSFSEYTVIPEMRLVKINPKAPLEKVSLFGCCIPTGYGSALFSAKVHVGSTCGVWGLGGVGMSMIAGCRKRGAKKIIGVDINSDKFEAAKKLGCTDVINPKEHDKPIEEVLKEITGDGLDYAFVAVGNKEVLKTAFMSTRIGVGKTIVIALVAGDISIVPIGLLMGRTIKGNYYGDTKTLVEIPKMVNEYLEGKFPLLDELITHVIPLEDINKGFDMMKKGESLKSVVLMKKEK